MDTVGKNKKVIAEYIRNQLQEDIATDPISIKEYIDLFEEKEKQKRKKTRKEKDHFSGSRRKKCGWQTIQKGLSSRVPVQKPSRLKTNIQNMEKNLIRKKRRW